MWRESINKIRKPFHQLVDEDICQETLLRVGTNEQFILFFCLKLVPEVDWKLMKPDEVLAADGVWTDFAQRGIAATVSLVTDTTSGVLELMLSAAVALDLCVRMLADMFVAFADGFP